MERIEWKMGNKRDKLRLYMRLYMLFECKHYYPNGGWNDFIGVFESLDKAKEFAFSQEDDNGRSAHVVYRGKIIWQANFNDLLEKWEEKLIDGKF